MKITDYFNLDAQTLTFSRQQGSDFAKKVAADFNPIHDIDHKRFCVPGDLLFSVMLHHYGLRQEMSFKFAGIVDESKTITLPECEGNELTLKDAKDKSILEMKCSGEHSNNADLIATLSENYVKFSGRTFPDILAPLMQKHNVMINPDRPLVMYESMCLSFNTLEIDNIELTFDSSELQVNGKRGYVSLNYLLHADGKVIGKGQKKMLLSGLRPYEATTMDEVIAYYDERRITLA